MKKLIKALVETYLFESFKSNAIQLLVDNGKKISTERDSSDKVSLIICMTPNGSLWRLMDIYSGKISNNNKHSIKIKSSGYNVSRCSNFLGEIGEEDIYQNKFMIKDEYIKFVGDDKLQTLRKLCAQKNLCAVFVTDINLNSIDCAIFLNNSAFEKIENFFKKQDDRVNNNAENTDKLKDKENSNKITKAYISTLIKTYQSDFGNDTYMKLIELSKDLISNKIPKEDITSLLKNVYSLNSRNQSEAKLKMFNNLLAYMMEYGYYGDNVINKKKGFGFMVDDIIRKYNKGINKMYDTIIKAHK